ncbi:cobaltochelatase subunit CobN [Thermosynechococcus vestitus]|uniref:Cobalamin biosynthetic protein n=1 Tax=Thermosynechococcus vestitus (strain NIES-2133 / IAM M-273 / BP-1) TaxID=197221 RepID=Q8DKF9_THEVB|nr:cobaltochelatase subunit CobN [Thermosynechococcus vestitus]BAC08452.1 cobalamin biosynthetic protein [Thermosynechococcus vestitus BP-1]
MHRILTLNDLTVATDNSNVAFLQQSSAPIVILTGADTDIALLAQAYHQLPKDFPPLRLANLLHLQAAAAIDDYGDRVLAKADVVVIRLLGGRGYWSYGLEVAQQMVSDRGGQLILLPGDDRPDLELMSLSSWPLAQVDRLWQYFCEGGQENIQWALEFIGHYGCGWGAPPRPPQRIPRWGTYPISGQIPKDWPQVGILFYRAHYLAGNTAVIEALAQALMQRQLAPVAVFVSSLQDPEIQRGLLAAWQGKVELILNTTGFAIAKASEVDLWQQLDVPVLQVILSSSTYETWQQQPQGLTPRDLAMHVVLPEVDGRIITRAVSFKAVSQIQPEVETAVTTYAPVGDRLDWVSDLAANWLKLRRKAPAERRIALILANYPCRDGRLANGVGLDTPNSTVELLKALQAAGYDLGPDPLPRDGDALIQHLSRYRTNDPEGNHWRLPRYTLSLDTYQHYFRNLPRAVQTAINQRWPAPTSDLPIAGDCWGNIFVGIQPSRGYDRDPSLNYHAPDLEPTPEYLAFYFWLRHVFGADAIVHVGKHGNLEWLPGKGIALSEACFPEIALGPVPHFYPFIVNDPGEGAQAKRRAQAVILDHLTPPLTRAELYGGLETLSHYIEEYYAAEQFDRPRLTVLRQQIEALVKELDLDQEISAPNPEETWTAWLARTDGYLCDLRDAQIRDGLHILGQCPQGRQLRDLILAIARSPSDQHRGLTRALAQDQGVDLDPLTADPTAPSPVLGYRSVGQWQNALEETAATLVEGLLRGTPNLPGGSATQQVLDWIRTVLYPALQQTRQEIDHFLHGLNGGYVPSGAAGAPSRGRPDVLPTGRNFYAVDLRSVPTEAAWALAERSAAALIERYCQEQGDFPRTLGLSVWGTATMRTGGDDIAQALALLGVRPVWEGASRRVVDLEVIPLSLLGRPRVDVMLRISGFFRDAFPNLIALFDEAVQRVSQLDEPPDQNPLAAQVAKETAYWQQQGLSLDQAQQRARFRIFGSKPGAYGAGLQGLIEAQNWRGDEDLARAYIHWSSYAYTGAAHSHNAAEALEQRLSQLQVVLQNQDNREHDLLDSDDYYQFQGGLTVAVRSRSGQQPTVYFGDHSRPEQPKIRTLQEELLRVYRSRVVNPKWLTGVKRHGYKGAFEMAATVDYLFGYAATARCVPDYVFTGIAQTYLLDSEMQAFVAHHNPWALRDMAERLLEAAQRQLWQPPDPQMLDRLRSLALEAEGLIEGNSAP